MAVLDERGLHGLSMRAVAGVLGVQVGALYYHLPDKQALLRAMADRLCERALENWPAPSGDWQVDAQACCTALRRAMLSSPDGARLIMEGPLLGSVGALEVMERLIESLGRTGLPAGPVRIGADALMSYVTGFVLQEQLAPAASVATAPGDLAGLMERFPLVFGAEGDLGGISGDELFRSSVELILSGLREHV